MALEVVAFVLLVHNNNFHNARFLNFSRELTGSYYERVDKFQEYLSLQEENKKLARENVLLKNELARYKSIIDNHAKIDSSIHQNYNYIEGRVINNSINKQSNFITINRGRDHGVKPEMAVISNNGVVGMVTGVSSDFSMAIPLINKNMRISAKHLRSGYFGSLIWPGITIEEAVLKEIPLHAIINVGDTIVTSGYSAIYPEGITIGYVSDFEEVSGTFYEIKVNFSVDFRKLSNVNIIQNLHRNELLNLQREIESND